MTDPNNTLSCLYFFFLRLWLSSEVSFMQIERFYRYSNSIHTSLIAKATPTPPTAYTNPSVMLPLGVGASVAVGASVVGAGVVTKLLQPLIIIALPLL